MKFTFPFFGKKSHFPDAKILESQTQGLIIPIEEKVVIDWNSVEVNLAPDFHSISDENGRQTSSFMSQVEEGSTSLNKNDVISSGVDENPLVEPAASLQQPAPEKDMPISFGNQNLSVAEPEIMGGALLEAASSLFDLQSSNDPAVILQEPVSEKDVLRATENQELLAPQAQIMEEPLPEADLTKGDLQSPSESITSVEPAVVMTQSSASIPSPSESEPLLMAREDVIAAYKIFLNRLPESLEVIESRVNSSLEANLIDFALSDEFIRRADLPAIIFPLAKKIIEAGETAQSTNQSPGEVVG